MLRPIERADTAFVARHFLDPLVQRYLLDEEPLTTRAPQPQSMSAGTDLCQEIGTTRNAPRAPEPRRAAARRLRSLVRYPEAHSGE